MECSVNGNYSVEQLSLNLKELVEKRELDKWKGTIDEFVKSQFISYEKIAGELERSLRGELATRFKEVRHLTFETKYSSTFDTSQGISRDRITYEIIPRLNDSGIALLENDIEKLRQEVKWDMLEGVDHERTATAFKAANAEKIGCGYLLTRLEEYMTKLREYLNCMEESNQSARRLLNYSKISWGIFGRSIYKAVIKGFMEELFAKYKAAQLSYKDLNRLVSEKYDSGSLLVPYSLGNISEETGKDPEIVEIINELKSKDPKPKKIHVEKGEQGEYTIKIESTNDYEMDEPWLSLLVGYRDGFGKDRSTRVDLTTQGDYGVFLVEPIETENGKSIQTKLKVNPSAEKGIKLVSLKVNGGYELPYVEKAKSLAEVTLTRPIAELI